MSDHFARAALLFDQSKYDLAEEALRRTISEEPDHARAHSLLGLCLAERKSYADATDEAQAAIHLAPDDWFVHYVMGHVFWQRNRLSEASTAVQEAIRLNPMDASPWGVLALIEHGRKRWKESLEAAERGLQIEPDNAKCQNARSMALVKLGRRAEAAAAASAALADNPENALSQANLGWAFLHGGDHRKAKEHFREALRLAPEMEWAQQGMVMALKARNPVYRLLLTYFLWMSKLSTGAQWALIIGLVVGVRVVRSVAQNNPGLASVAWAIIIAYAAFVAMSWLADPLFNLLLRLDRFGRYVLSRDERSGANLVGLCILVAFGSVATGIATGAGAAFLAAVCAALLILPASAVFRCDAGWPRWGMALYTGGLALLAGGVVGTSLTDSPSTGTLMAVFILGAVLSTWLANVMMSSTVKH